MTKYAFKAYRKSLFVDPAAGDAPLSAAFAYDQAGGSSASLGPRRR